MSLIDTINNIENDYANNDAEWIHYIHDHRKYLTNNSVVHPIDPSSMHIYEYRPEAYLNDKNLTVSSATWIVLWLNQIYNASDFNHLTELRIPNEEILIELKNSYDTYIHNQIEADREMTLIR